MSQPNIIILIPIYYAELRPFEAEALAHNLDLLHRYPASFVIPDGLDISNLRRQYPQVGVVEVSPDWLGTRRGIAGYNEMMMSASFYELFSQYEYMLICHVDAWVFRDDLPSWCARDYDHVAAPWPMRPRYGRFPLKQYLQIKLWFKPKRKILHCQMFNRIGNGGFSLRRVQAFRETCIKYADDIRYFNTNPHPLYNEDLFWALIPHEIKVPAVEEALTFSFDLKPQLCYQLNHEQLPMACHGFNKPGRSEFWKPFVPAVKSL